VLILWLQLINKMRKRIEATAKFRFAPFICKFRETHATQVSIMYDKHFAEGLLLHTEHLPITFSWKPLQFFEGKAT